MPAQGKMGRLRLLRIVLLPHPGYDHSRTVIGQIKPVPDSSNSGVRFLRNSIDARLNMLPRCWWTASVHQK